MYNFPSDCSERSDNSLDKLTISNKYVRFGISCFNLLYLFLISVLAMWTFLYTIELKNETTFYVVYIALNVIFFILLMMTRNQFFTRIVSLLLLIPVFVLVLFSSSPALFIPPFVVGVLMFFICGAGDTPKIIWGSFYLILFIVGIIVFYIMSTLFGGSAVETILDSSVTDTAITEEYDMGKIAELNANSVSPDGKYRYYIIDVQDNDRGKVIIVVEPNDMDVNYQFFTLIEEGYSVRIAKYSTRGVTPDIEWVVNEDYNESGETTAASYKLRYRFGENAEWKTSTINIPTQKNYLTFLNVD